MSKYDRIRSTIGIIFMGIMLLEALTSCKSPPSKPEIDPLAHGPGYAPAYPPYDNGKTAPSPPIEADPPEMVGGMGFEPTK